VERFSGLGSGLGWEKGWVVTRVYIYVYSRRANSMVMIEGLRGHGRVLSKPIV